MMDDPAKAPDLYHLTLHPTADELEAGQATLPKQGEAPVPGKKA
jgi:hypothetical protein